MAIDPKTRAAIEEHVRKTVESWPPLSQEQIEKIRHLMAPMFTPPPPPPDPPDVKALRDVETAVEDRDYFLRAGTEKLERKIVAAKEAGASTAGIAQAAGMGVRAVREVLRRRREDRSPETSGGDVGGGPQEPPSRPGLP